MYTILGAAAAPCLCLGIIIGVGSIIVAIKERYKKHHTTLQHFTSLDQKVRAIAYAIRHEND